MNRWKAFSLTLLLAASALASCSGPFKGSCTTNCVGGGNASVSVSISDSAPANTSILSFTLPIQGITLTPSSGSPVSLTSSAKTYELTRFQTDSALVASNVSVAPGTYTAVNVTVSAPSAVFFNGSGATIGSCPNGAVCSVPQGAAATITFTFPTGSPLVLTANQNQWIGLDFNYSNAIVTTGGIGIDVTQKNVLTALTTPLTGVPSSDFANIDDFAGQVTAISSSSITVKSTVRGTLTASINSSTIPVNDPQGKCSGGASFSCVKMGAVVSLQGVLTNTGTINGTELDIIDASTMPTDEIEGTLYTNASCSSGFGMILSDSSITTTSSPLASAGFGQNVCLTLSVGATFVVDTGILTNQGVPTSSFTGSGDLFAGQTVRAKVSNAVSGTNVINATGSALILRFARLTATVSNSGTPAFTITGLPVYFASTPTTTPAVQTYVNATLFEGVSGVAGLASGQTVSISALFLNPSTALQPFQAAKVRVP